jgi:hypothetical protein
VSDPRVASTAEPSWKVGFVRNLERLGDDAYVQNGAAAIKRALDELLCNAYVQAQLDEVSRAGDPSAIALIQSGQAPLGKGQSLVIDADWSLKHVEDRHQRWLIQQWRFVRDCAAESRCNKTWYGLEALLPLLRRWTERNLVPEATEHPEQLSWHDHATALRAVNLIWLSCLLRTSPIPETQYLPLLFALVETHTTVLAAADFYTEGNNHGFDQAAGLYFLACAFPISRRQLDAKEVARKRLIFELGWAFNEEGVHIENSPSYHVTMMARLLRAERLLDAFDGVPPLGVTETVEKAMHFLSHAWKPDRTLPLLGDSEAVPVHIDLDTLKGFNGFPELQYVATAGRSGRKPDDLSAIFPKAGYAFLRDAWPSEGEPRGLHLTFKCGYLSQYHRHDDDNTILLFAFGEDWLIGSGIYKYHEQDEIRKYLRSARAHNILSVDDAPCSRILKAAGAVMHTAMIQGAGTTVRAESNMFVGFGYQRSVGYDRETSQITIVDVMQPAEEGEFSLTLRFHVPKEHELALLATDRVRVSSKQSGRSMLIEVESAALVSTEVVSGQASPPLGWTSPQCGLLEPANTIGFKLRGAGRVEVTSQLSFE